LKERNLLFSCDYNPIFYSLKWKALLGACCALATIKLGNAKPALVTAFCFFSKKSIKSSWEKLIMKTMKALVLADYNRFELREVQKPQPGMGEVLIQVRACGICGSDVHGMDGSTGRRIPPIIMGHEAAGTIEAVGGGVTGWQPGDRVTFDSTVYCGYCRYCMQGLVNLCDNRRVLGVSCPEYKLDGAFADYVVVPQHILYALPENIPFSQAAMIEPLSVGFHAVHQTPTRLNDTAVVLGAGMIGLVTIQALRLAGCGKIIAVDVAPERLEMARQYGADIGMNSANSDVPAAVLAETGGMGADIALEAVGINPTFNIAIDCLKKNGHLTVIGNLAPVVDFPLQKVVTRQITVGGTYASAGEYPACIAMLARGAVRVDGLISAEAPLEQGAEWFQRLHNREEGLMKVVLTP
jgi:L-iditol 2-dehydrogenase